MKTKMLTLALAAFSLLACKQEPMKPQQGYIGPADLKIEDGRMTPEVLLSLGRLSDPQLSPDGKTILYGVSYTSIAENRSVRNLFTLPAEGGAPTQLTMDGKSISNARWSPDGGWIFFLQGGQVWKAPYKAGKLGKRVQVTDVERGIDEFTLSEDKTDEENRQIVLDWLFGENLKFTPDKGWSYSNSNYMLLAMIVEKASGEDYHSFVRKNIFEPLGMSNSSFCADTLGDPRVCEDSSGEDFDSLPYVYKWAYLNTKGDGDIVSNAADIDKWLGSLREGTILSKESIAAMTTNYSGTNNYGYGLSLDGDIVYHGGDISTFESAALTVPGDNINIFIVTNNAQAAWDKNLSISTVALRVAKKVLG